MKLFCKAYESDEDAAGQLGVILSQHYLGDETMRRASLKDSYQFILDDLDRAAELLELEEDFNTDTQGTLYDSIYFNEYTVHAPPRPRTSLYEAVGRGHQVCHQSHRQRLLLPVELHTGSHFERKLLQIHVDQRLLHRSHLESGLYHQFLRRRAGTGIRQLRLQQRTSRLLPAEWVINLYDLNDLRVSTYFQSFTTGYSHGLTWPLLIKYFGNESFVNYNILHVSMPKVLRLSEQYLIRAEAYVQQEHPDYGKAGSDISVLRTARYASYGGYRHEQGKCNGCHRTGTRKGTLHGRLPPARPETLAQRI